MSRVRTRLEQYKAEIGKKSQYKNGLPGSALDIVNTLLNDLEQDEKENGWIPVSERLPEKHKDVIATVKYKGFLGMYGTWLKTAFVDDYGEWNGECAGGEVIAWMYLPKPYKEG